MTNEITYQDSLGDTHFPSGYYDSQKVGEIYKIAKDMSGEKHTIRIESPRTGADSTRYIVVTIDGKAVASSGWTINPWAWSMEY